MLAADFDESLRLITCERGLFGQAAKEQTSLRKFEESVLLNSAVLVILLLPVSWQVQVMTETSFLEQVDFQQRFLKCPSDSVCSAAIQNHSKALGRGILED